MNADTKKFNMVHELGHLLCAKELGYEAVLDYVSKKNFSTEVTIDIRKSDLKTLEDYAVIFLGGRAAEELVYDLNSPGFLFSDHKKLYNVMKIIYELQNKEFIYLNATEMKRPAYADYYDKSKQILLDFGGKQVLEAIATSMIDEFFSDKSKKSDNKK